MLRLSGLWELDREILALLPGDRGPGWWLTATAVALVVDCELVVARTRLESLSDRGLVRDDWRHPPAFARTLAGDLALGAASERAA